MNDTITIAAAETREDMASIRALFIEYQRHLALDLDFQNFGVELAALPGKYGPPRGLLLLGRYSGEVAGCAAFYPMSNTLCEFKRLYVRRAFAGKGVGKALMEAAIAAAKAAGYTHMRLDSLRRMTEAGKLYLQYGFYEIAPYNENPYEDVYYMEREL